MLDGASKEDVQAVGKAVVDVLSIEGDVASVLQQQMLSIAL
jgi:hypothetical protein